MPNKLTQDAVLQRFVSVHGDKYDYSQVLYVTMHVKVEIICPEHGAFQQRPCDHINLESGCPKCSGHNFTDEERFWKFVDKTDYCWIWTSKTNKRGYGWHRLYGHDKPRGILAHRFSYALHFGQIPIGILVCHECDNPRCVRPDHLFLGTSQDNVDDMMNKGRSRHMSGEDAGQAKLTKIQVAEIRHKSLMGATGTCLSIEYGISKAQISRIINCKRWKNAETNTKDETQRVA